MEFEKYLNFLHKVHERISRESYEKPNLSNEQIIEMARPDSDFFKKNFAEDYKELESKYQKQFKDSVENIFNYKTKKFMDDVNLIEESGAEGALRRVFEKNAKDEYNDLKEKNYNFKKMSYPEFIDEIKKGKGMFGHGVSIDNFERDYEGWKNITPEQINKSKELYEELQKDTDDVWNKKKVAFGEILKERYPEKFEGRPGAENDLEYLRELNKGLPNKEQDQITDQINARPEVKDAMKKKDDSYFKYHSETSPVIDLYINNDDYFKYKPSGTEFPFLDYDKKDGKQIKLPSDCECDVNIKMNVVLNNVKDKTLFTGLAELSISEGINKGLNNKPSKLELI